MRIRRQYPPKVEPARLDPDERSPQLGLKYKDLAVLGAMMEAGFDLLQPREVNEYCYAPTADAAAAVANAVGELGFTVVVREPDEQQPEWSIVATQVIVLDPAFVRDTTDAMEAIAAEHGATYDGWDAGPDQTAEPEPQTE